MTEDDNNGEHREPGEEAHSDSSGRTDSGNTGTPAACSVGSGPEGTSTSIRAGKIIGYRAWVYQSWPRYPWCPNEHHLESLYIPAIWKPHELMYAKCYCSCYATGKDTICTSTTYHGIHAFKTIERLKEETCPNPNLNPTIPSRTYVYGTIEMWGDVIEHVDGYRAQYARIKTLDEMIRNEPEEDLHEALEKLRTLYGV